MDFMIQSIQEVCDFYDVDYYELMKKIGLEHYYGFDKETIWIELLDSEKIQLSKELNTIIPFFYGIISKDLLLEKKLTLDEYQKAVDSCTLDKYFEEIGVSNFLTNSTTDKINEKLFLTNGNKTLKREELNSIVTFINKDKRYLIDIDKLPANEEIYLNLVNVQPTSLKNLKFQTEKICIAAVSKFAHAIEYVIEQTENIAKASVVKNGLVLEFVKPELHTEEVVKHALKQNPLSFKFSKLKTYELCLMAVKENGINYEFVPEELRTHEMKMEALQSNGWAIKFFDIQTEEYALTAVLQNAETALCINEDIRENNTIIKLIYQEIIKKHSFLN